MPLPLYMQNEGEMMAAVEEEDNFQSPVDSIGSLSSSHVVDAGNRVLDLIEKHKQEIRARMDDREKSFREMLQQESENHRGRRGRDRERSNGSGNSAETSSSSATRGSNTLKETFVDAYLTAVRHAEANSSHQARKAPEPRRNVASTYSDEYLDIPQPHSDGVNQFVPNNTAAPTIHLDPKEAVNIKRRTESPNRAANDMRSRKDQYEQSQKYGRSFSPRVSPKRRSSDDPEAESGLDPVVAEERLYVPDEHHENSKDGFNSSSSDDDDGDDGVPVNRANNNHVTFQSENQHEFTDPSGNAVASASLRQMDDLNINHDDNDYDTTTYDDDEDSRRSSSNPEDKPSQVDIDTTIHTDKSEDSFDNAGALDEGLGKPWSRKRVAPRTDKRRQVPSSSSSSDIGNASIEDDSREHSWKDMSEHWIDYYSWHVGVVLVVLLMAIGIYLMSSDDSLQNPVVPEGTKRLRRRSRNYGPLL